MTASDKVAERLSQAASEPDYGVAVQNILSSLKSLSSSEAITGDLKAIGDDLFDKSIGIVTARTVLDNLISTLKTYEDDGMWIEVGMHLLRGLEGTSQASFLDQVASLSDLVATAHENQESFQEAAKLLASIPLDSSQRRVTEEDKARVWIRIIRNYLEVDESIAAEPYMNRLKSVMPDVHDPELQLHFKLSQARIHDANRAFIAASKTYHDISYSPAIAEEERLHTLSMAIKCAVLSPAGPSRSRALGRLYKDDRSAGLDEFAILEKMFLNRLLEPGEIDKFAKSLPPHQLATTSDGSTVLAKAMLEHNLLGVSRLYRNIQFQKLASLLDLDASKAEETTARMVEQGRLLGRIDQVDGVIWFEGGEASGENGSGRADSAVDKELRQWDANVQSLAEEVENITDMLQQQFPDFVAGNLVV